MSNSPGNKKGLVPGVSWQEIVAFLSLFVIMSLLYGFPDLIRGRASWHYVRETAVDCLFMFISCIPPWWLHFRKLAHWSLKKRFWFHLPTSIIYYFSWIGLYAIYNPLTGKAPITAANVLVNIGPNLLFYVQIFSFLHIYHFFRERELQLKKEKELSSLAYNSEINALKAQIQPHFLFNTLNSISASVPPEQETTRELIAKLADTFRYALYVTQHEWVPLHEEAAFINTILELENRRFGKRLQFEIGCLKEAGNIIVPSMLLQPLVENAIRHGIAPSLNGGRITVGFERTDSKLKVTVSDTGKGYQGEVQEILSARGVGLRNARQRLELLFNETLYMERNHPSGMIFYFYIPIHIMSVTTVLIIDDEEASRSLIRQYLQAHPEMDILGECENGIEAVRAINEEKPDLVFLDVQMPGLNGFEVLQEIAHIPMIIFTTAFDRFAIKAFEMNAVDYLLKPYTRQRFDLSMERIRQRTDQHGLYSLAASIPVQQGSYPPRIFVETPGRLRSLDVQDILYLKAEKDYTRIHITGQSYLGSQGISVLEKRLDPQRFLRVHRSYIVNIYHVREVYREISKTFLVMNDETEIVVGRSYLESLKKLIY